MKKLRKCATCGEKYQYCPNCDRNAPAWMAQFHEENCKNIYQICVQHNVGLLTKEQAKEALNACDLSNKENFAECIQRDFANIFAEESKVEDQPKKRGKRAEMPIIEEVVNLESHEVVKENE